jgi:hypothetical protein
MYAQYVYKAGSTKANVLADIVALLTGTTNKALLSADCVQVNTEILTTESVAGWTLHDGAAGTNRVILSAPCEDAVFTKYVGIDINTDGNFKFGGASTWDAVAHTGTKCIVINNDPVAFSGFINVTHFSLAAGGTIFIQASVRHLFIYCRIAAANCVGFLVTEFSREGINTTDTTYPNWFIIEAASGGGGWRPFCKSPVSAGEANSANGYMNYTGVSFTIPVTPSYSQVSGIVGQATFRNASEVVGYEAIPLDSLLLIGGYIANLGTVMQGSGADILGKNKAPGMYCKAGGNFDTMILNGKTYIRISNLSVVGSVNWPIWFLMG